MTDRLVRHVPVGVSVEQLAAGWARQEAAPNGATVIVDHEISGRMRLGIPWQVRSADALSCATIIRPDLRPEAEAVLWVVALVAAATTVAVRPGWPDLLFDDADVQVGAVTMEAHLGPGSITSAVLTLRVDLHALGLGVDRPRLAERFAAAVVEGSRQLTSDRPDLLDAYANRSALIGRRVRAKLLPKGETRGRAAAIDPMGSLILESPTGMLERLTPHAVLRVDPAPDALT